MGRKFFFIVIALIPVGCGGNSPPVVDRNKTSIDSNRMEPRVAALLREWRKEARGEHLVIDLEAPALRIGESESSVALPDEYEWKAYHVKPEGRFDLPESFRLKLRAEIGQENVCKEFFALQGKLTPEEGLYFVIWPEDGLSSGTGVATWRGYTFQSRRRRPDSINESMLVTSAAGS
jgi:hypothetical protein